MKLFTRLGLTLVLGAAMACSDSPSNPLAPSSAATGGSVAAVPEGTPTLKVTAPGSPAPGPGTEIAGLTPPVLSVSNAQALFAGAVQMQTRFQLNEETTLIAEPLVAAGGDGRSSWQHAGELKYNTTYRWRARAELGDAYGPWSAVWEFKTPQPPAAASTGGANFRTPDPPPGQRLPLPFRLEVVNRVASQYPAAWRNSCQDRGGSWEFLDILVDQLRKEDNRWGYNWKRGNVGDPSQDIVAYHHGPGPSEGSTAVYIVDIMLSHCGSPAPAWIDQTGVTAQQGAIGRWTGRGRFTN